MYWEVARTIRLSKVIEADSREDALELFDEVNADTKLISEIARPLKGEIRWIHVKTIHAIHDPRSEVSRE